jgi:hypothetical protein
VVVLQALPSGQSPAALHPQAPETHTWPAEALVQSTQASPLTPQAPFRLPALHKLLGGPEQQPPLQVSPPAQ